MGVRSGKKRDFRENASRAMARVLRHEDVNKIRYMQKELTTIFVEMTTFRNVDGGVLQSMVRGKVRALERCCSETMNKLAKVWYEWCGVAENGTALEWCRVEEQIAVKGVQCPDVPMAFRYTSLLSPSLKSDRRAQRAAYDVSRFAAGWSKGFGPPVTEVDWFWLMAKMGEAPTVKVLRNMSGTMKRLISV